MKTSIINPALCIFFTALLIAACPALAEDKAPAQPDVAAFTKLRMDYAKRPDFNAMYKMDDQRDAILAAYKVKDYAKVIALTKPWLEKCPVDAEMHYIRAQALNVQGDITHYAYELYFFYGNARCNPSPRPATARARRPPSRSSRSTRKYYLLNDFGAKLGQQSLQGHCDVMKCTLPDGKEVTYYFDATIPLASEAKDESEKLAPRLRR